MERGTTELEKRVWEALNGVKDPHLGVSVVEMGLIYEVKEYEPGKINVKMTLTTPGCPLGDRIVYEVDSTVASVEGVRENYTDLVFDPPWTPAKMSERLKKLFGID
jgi:metal-sulfur cluster biosynthetic enzyme